MSRDTQASIVTSGAATLHRTRSVACLACGSAFLPAREWHRYCSDACRAKWWKASQRVLPLEPAPEPAIPVLDQRVPRRERARLRPMSRAILERLERGPALASELQAMFPAARSVRTRISDVGLWVRPDRRLRSAPVRGVVGEWRYWLEAVDQ